MDSSARCQIRLILENNRDLTQNEFEQKQQALKASHAAKGVLQSGATIKVTVRQIEESVRAFVTHSVDQVLPVDRSPEAFAMIREGLENYYPYVRDELDDLVRLAARGSEAAFLTARDLFRQIEARVNRQLEIHRFTFIGSSAREAQPDAALTPARNAGGKPLAAHWDDMWSTIAVMIFNGDLQPKTQADLENAMKDWFAESNISIGDTAVRRRARQLWQKLEADA